jgi:trehalose-6-phosphate synthase
MDLSERKGRYEALFAGVRKDDVTAWRESFVGALEATRG